ncbi:MAG: PRC-barrel domain protein [Pedosphaera sp.]|nr:PRC-barrel domain protein [Pedosphaera sp.]
MLRSVKQLHGYKLGALDGEIGHVRGFYFDEKDWVIRYLVADTGSWMPEREVLISPYALGSIYAGGKLIEVKLTREKVENSPAIDTALPIARQHESDYYRYYNWPVYWGGPGIWGLGPLPVAPPLPEPPAKEPQESVTTSDEGKTQIRNTQELIGYTVQAIDGDIGHVEDLLLDDESWSIRFLVVTTGHWWSGKNVLVPRQSIERVSWEESKVFVNLTRTAIQNEPKYEYTGPNADDHDPRVFR